MVSGKYTVYNQKNIFNQLTIRPITSKTHQNKIVLMGFQSMPGQSKALIALIRYNSGAAAVAF